MRLISSIGANDIVTMAFNPWTETKPPPKSAVGFPAVGTAWTILKSA
ncbi:MAG TPA: hypothetical protein VK957_02700 [Lunatimonas sp.]|nr:hypothetical protein [Lunatimonas sp.]